MAKIIFVAVLAFLAVQSSNASLSKSGPLDLLQDGPVKDLIQELNILLSKVSSRSSSLFLELNNKFSELQQAANIPQLISEMKQEAQQTLSQSDANDCKDWAEKHIYLLEREASVMTCRFTVDDDAVELRKQLQELVNKVENLLKEIGQDVFKCLTNGDLDKCMEDKVADVKQQLEIVEKAIEVTFDALEASVPMFTDKMSQCVDEKKQSLLVKMQEFGSDLENCIKSSNVMIVNHLVKKVDHVLELPNGFTIFSDKINEISANYNLNYQVDDLQKEVAQLLAGNEKEERLCGPKAQELIRSLVKDAENDEKNCLVQAQTVAKDLQDKVVLLNERMQSLTELLGSKIRECKRQNIRNIKGFFACLEVNTKDLEQKLHLLELEAMQVSYLTNKSIKEVQTKLEACLGKVENKVTLEGRAVVSGLNQCIQNIDMLYSRNFIHQIIAERELVAIVMEYKEKMENLLNVNDKFESICGPKSRKQIEELVKEVQDDAQTCFDNLLNEDFCLEVVRNKATFAGQSIVDDTNQCIKTITY